MGRKVVELTITAEGRDKDKTFILTELPAAKAERWAMRALHVMSVSGVEIPDEAILGGMAVVAIVGLRALFAGPPAEFEPLMDEMMSCVRMKVAALPDGRPLTEDDIEDVTTYIQLRDEVLKLHTGFSIADALKMMASAQSFGRSNSDQAASSESSAPSPPPSVQ